MGKVGMRWEEKLYFNAFAVSNVLRSPKRKVSLRNAKTEFLSSHLIF